MKKVFPYITSFILLLSLLLGSIYYVTLDTDFYQKQYEKNGTAEYIGMSEEDLMKATNVLIDYMKDDLSSLDVEATVKGQVRQVFDQREKDHMVDVKVLFGLLEKAFFTLIILWIFGLFAGIFLYKEEVIRVMARAFIPTALVFSLGIGILSGVFVWNFDWFWTNFHLLIFTNDLWLLDPKVSIMINMFPLEFFYACCFRIVGAFVGTVTLMGLMSYTVKSKIVRI